MEPWTLETSYALFVGAATVIAFAGTRLSRYADQLADRTGWGEALMGAVFLGACTSLPGITASVTAAWDGLPVLAMSNALGGIAVQTAFLAIADCFYRKANLEHAAASVANIMMGALLIALLATIMVGMTSPAISVWGVHPVTPLLFLGYLFGMRLIYRSRAQPMWRPRMTTDTRVDVPDETDRHKPPIARLWILFGVSAVLVIIAGRVVMRSAETIVAHTGLSQSLAGGLLTAVCTSLPELVTSIAAVRQGALTLAVGGVLGGNAFDTLFAAAADVAYRDGSIYHRISGKEELLIALTIVMSAVLILGLLRREKSGLANIGFESVLVLMLYVIGIAILGFF